MSTIEPSASPLVNFDLNSIQPNATDSAIDYDAPLHYDSNLLDLFNFHGDGFHRRRSSLSASPITIGGVDLIPTSTVDGKSMTEAEYHASWMSSQLDQKAYSCCGLDFPAISDLLVHYETEHVDIQSKLPTITEESLDHGALLRVESQTPPINDDFGALKLQEPLGASQLSGETLFMPYDHMTLVAPSAKRSRVPSISTSSKKMRETGELGDMLDQWMMAPAAETNNASEYGFPQGENLILPFDAPVDYMNDYMLHSQNYPHFEMNSLPARSQTTPPTLSHYEPESPLTRYSSPALSESDSRRYRCPKAFCSKVCHFMMPLRLLGL